MAVPAAYASQRATGDGVLELKAVYGTVQIGTPLRPARGALWGQMDSGTLKVLDPDATDKNIFVSGYDGKPVVTDTPYGKQSVYTGRDLHFRVTGGRYKLSFQGTSIDLTAVGVGVARLSGDPTALNAGKYTIDDSNWIAVPVYLLPGQWWSVPFGDQTQTTQPQTTTTP